MLERTGSLAAECADAAPAQRIARENGYELAGKPESRYRSRTPHSMAWDSVAN